MGVGPRTLFAGVYPKVSQRPQLARLLSGAPSEPLAQASLYLLSQFESPIGSQAANGKGEQPRQTGSLTL